MKDKKIIKIVILAIILLLLLLVYKIIMLNKYKSDKVEIDSSSIFNETLTITHSLDDSASQKIKMDGLIIKDYFTGYEKSEDVDYYIKYDDAREVESYYYISSSKQYIELLNADSFVLYAEGDDSQKSFDTESNMKAILEKENIKNDVDFLKYIKENYYLKNNIFTCTKTMRNNFLINTFVEVSLPYFKNIVLLDGSVNGYIMNLNNNIREIHLLNGDKQYIILLSGDELISNEFITQLLSTVEFE